MSDFFPEGLAMSRPVFPKPGGRIGFSLVELLVALAIMAILTGLLVPGIQRAREAANRLQCCHHLRQLGVALVNHESVFGAFPAPYGPDHGSSVGVHWPVRLLPFLEQEALGKGFDTASPWNDPRNLKASTTRVAVFTCPSVRIPRGVANAAPGGLEFGGLDYAPMRDIDPDLLATGLVGKPLLNQGALGQPGNNAVPSRILEFTDGASNTLILGEDAALPVSMIGGKPTGRDFSPAGWAGPYPETNLDGCHADGTLAGPIAMNGTNAWEFYSFHAGGGNFLMADGRIARLAGNVPIGIVAAMVTRAGGEPTSTPE
ncbi:MAG: DUF1559 domain-containing protein [Planctomycetes bacterium]|nr:DUF1559 domain-containing protein [Planctomycetota bacterium]